MKLLFKNSTKLSADLYSDFLNFHQNKYNNKYIFINALSIILLLFCMFTTFQSNLMNLFVLFTIILMFFIGYRFLYPIYKVKQESESEKVQNEYVNNFYFYDNHFVVSNFSGKSSYKYFKLYRVFEDDTYFYLYIDENYAFILKKDGFKLGNYNDFSSFMHKKLPFKYHVSKN